MTEARKLIESMVAAFNRGDIPFILGCFTSDCTLRETMSPDIPYAGTFTGRTGAAAFFDKMGGAFQPERLDIDLWVCEGDNVVAMGSWSAMARATGKRFESWLALYFRVRDGKVINFRGHDDTAVTAAALK